MKLSIEEKTILSDCVDKRAPELKPLLESLENGMLTADQTQQLRQVLLNEMYESGLEEDDEPNKYGVELDDIIGRLGDQGD